jgi:hypothetical protein
MPQSPNVRSCFYSLAVGWNWSHTTKWTARQVWKWKKPYRSWWPLFGSTIVKVPFMTRWKQIFIIAVQNFYLGSSTSNKIYLFFFDNLALFLYLKYFSYNHTIALLIYVWRNDENSFDFFPILNHSLFPIGYFLYWITIWYRSLYLYAGLLTVI